MLEKFVIHNFLPFFDSIRRKHSDENFTTGKGFKQRLTGHKLFYDNHRSDWSDLLKKSEKYFLENYLNTSRLIKGDWSRAICTLKNANEELNQRASFLSNYRIMFPVLLSAILGAGAFIGFFSNDLTLPESLVAFSGTLAFVGSIIGLVVIVEKFKIQKEISLHNQTINILDHLSKEHPDNVKTN